MKNVGLWIRSIKGVPLYKKSMFSHNSNKNPSIPLRFHFGKNPWFSTKFIGDCQDSPNLFWFVFPLFYDFPIHFSVFGMTFQGKIDWKDVWIGFSIWNHVVKSNLDSFENLLLWDQTKWKFTGNLKSKSKSKKIFFQFLEKFSS